MTFYTVRIKRSIGPVESVVVEASTHANAELVANHWAGERGHRVVRVEPWCVADEKILEKTPSTPTPAPANTPAQGAKVIK